METLKKHFIEICTVTGMIMWLLLSGPLSSVLLEEEPIAYILIFFIGLAIIAGTALLFSKYESNLNMRYLKMGGASYIVCIFYLYFRNFKLDTNNPNLLDWVAVSTFFNNSFQPLLLVVSVYLLYETLKTSKSELSETRILLEKQINTARYPAEIEGVRHKVAIINQGLIIDCTDKSKEESKDILCSIVQSNPQAEFSKRIRYASAVFADQHGYTTTELGEILEIYTREWLMKDHISAAEVLSYKQEHLANLSAEFDLFDKQDLTTLFKRIISNVLYPMVQSPNAHLYSELFVIEQYRALLETIVTEQDEELRRMMKREVEFLMLKQHRNTLDHYVELVTRADNLVHKFVRI